MMAPAAIAAATSWKVILTPHAFASWKTREMVRDEIMMMMTYGMIKIRLILHSLFSLPFRGQGNR